MGAGENGELASGARVQVWACCSPAETLSKSASSGFGF